jgi:N-acetylneuraminic acid mutarotase
MIVFGGEGNMDVSNGVFPEIDAYDLASNTWQRLGTMDVPRHGYGAAVIDGRIYLLGGATRQGGGAAAKSSVYYFE